MRYFQRTTNADITYQWLDIAKGECEKGRLADFCAKWDDVLGLLTRPSPSDFLLHNFLRHVSREGSMITIMFHDTYHTEWADPTPEQATHAYEWLRAEIALGPQAKRSRMRFGERGDIVGNKREQSHPVTPAVSDHACSVLGR